MSAMLNKLTNYRLMDHISNSSNYTTPPHPTPHSNFQPSSPRPNLIKSPLRTYRRDARLVWEWREGVLY